MSEYQRDGIKSYGIIDIQCFNVYGLNNCRPSAQCYVPRQSNSPHAIAFIDLLFVHLIDSMFVDVFINRNGYYSNDLDLDLIYYIFHISVKGIYDTVVSYL